jgi:hypothetical protein
MDGRFWFFFISGIILFITSVFFYFNWKKNHDKSSLGWFIASSVLLFLVILLSIFPIRTWLNYGNWLFVWVLTILVFIILPFSFLIIDIKKISRKKNNKGK